MIQTLMQIHANTPNTATIFNFTAFISALALLAILYTISNVRYHFRIIITPLSIFRISFYIIAFIGVSSLVSDFWFAEGWYLPSFINDQALVQSILGGLFLALVLIWMFVAFISPPIFNKCNFEIFTKTLYVIINKGSESELPDIADEIGRSADIIVKSCQNFHENQEIKIKQPKQKHYAHDLLMMIGHRKLCRYIISSAPGTAIEFFKSMSRHKKYYIPVHHFSVNISSEAFINLDSPIYHENDGARSGLFGQVKPFSTAIYGDYKLIEALGIYSPLDIDPKVSSNFTTEQLDAYCNCTLITIENYLATSKFHNPFNAINRALDTIKNSCADIMSMQDSGNILEDRNIIRRLYIATSFPMKVALLLDKYWPGSLHTYKRNMNTSITIYDSLAKFMFDLIFYAAHISSPADLCWSVQYASVWNTFFHDFRNSKSMDITLFKLRRLLYESVIQMDTWPNYVSAKILGTCLNIMGLSPNKQSLSKNYHTLHLMIIRWVIKNFQHLHINYPDLAKTALQGNIRYDATTNQLIGTYFVGMKREETLVKLQLYSAKK